MVVTCCDFLGDCGMRVGSGTVDGTNIGCVGCCVVEGSELAGKGEMNPVRIIGFFECGLVNLVVFAYLWVVIGTKYPLSSVEV